MKRLTLLSIVCAFFLGALTSCNFLDRKYEYTYGYDVQISVEDENDSKALQEYFKTNYLDKTQPKYYGDSNECLVHFINYFVEQEKTFDKDFIYSHLKKDTDYAAVMASMATDKNKEWVGTRVWRLEDLAEKTPSEE